MPVSLSRSRIFSNDTLDRSYHFRWASIWNLLYACFAYTSRPTEFILFSRYANVYVFTLGSLVIGMTYMFVDLFIKQYTRRLDADQYLCPLLKGITVPLILQSMLDIILSTRYTGDCALFLFTSLQSIPIWSICPKNSTVNTCLSTKVILQRCEKQQTGKSVPLSITSAHIVYNNRKQLLIIAGLIIFPKMLFNTEGKTSFTVSWRVFITAVIWILNFCLSTISDYALLKFYKIVLQCKIVGSVIAWTLLVVFTGRGKSAFMDVMDINVNSSIYSVAVWPVLTYGIGEIGVYDMGYTSPFTMIDNALLIFIVCFIIFEILKSMITRMLLLGLVECIDMDLRERISERWHYDLFALIPLSAEFLPGQKLITVYLYTHLTLATVSFLIMYTTTITRLIHSEFPNIKLIYIMGLFCMTGFILSTPEILVNRYGQSTETGLSFGSILSSLYLGGLRMAIIMWVYGVKKFSSDINFWLGFSPTKFWTVSWACLPAILLTTFGYQFLLICTGNDVHERNVAVVWFSAIFVVAFGSQTRIIVRYIMKNNLVGAIRCSKKYGPPKAVDRKRRQSYDPIVEHSECDHDCLALDEEDDCNHLPLMSKGELGLSNASESSLAQSLARSSSNLTNRETKIEKDKES